MTSELPAYLDAHLAAIEDTAQAATVADPTPWGFDDYGGGDQAKLLDSRGWSVFEADDYNATAASPTAAHIAKMDPAFTLAWCAAIRAVIALHMPDHADPLYCATCGDPWGFDQTPPVEFPCPTLRALARPFAGGEGWQEGWTL